MSEILEVPYWMEVGLASSENVVTVEIDNEGNPIAAMGGRAEKENLVSMEQFSSFYRKNLIQAIEKFENRVVEEV